MKYKGFSGKRRKLLSTILANGKGVITIDSVVAILGWDRVKARAFLSSLNQAGWIKSVKRGLYIPVPLESDNPELTNVNPFVLANYLYTDCYVGGWSAASFWGLTDQIFLKTWVIVKAPVKEKEEVRGNHTYALKRVSSSYFYGLYTEWIGQDKVYISDPHKTVIDFANFIDEYGMQSFMDVFLEYLRSEHKDLKVLLGYADKAKNKTVFKRIGFMLEKASPADTEFVDTCLTKIGKSVTLLSPKEKCETFVTKWRLWVPTSIAES